MPEEDRCGKSHIELNGTKVQILPFKQSAAYLGRALSFGDVEESEISNRINCGWAKFFKHRSELFRKRYPLQQRLRLFEAVVTPSVLYGAGTWNLTTKLKTRLRTAQRNMLLKMLGSGHKIRPHTGDEDCSSEEEEEQEAKANQDSTNEPNSESELESWVEWIARTTRTAE